MLGPCGRGWRLCTLPLALPRHEPDARYHLPPCLRPYAPTPVPIIVHDRRQNHQAAATALAQDVALLAEDASAAKARAKSDADKVGQQRSCDARATTAVTTVVTIACHPYAALRLRWRRG